MHFHLRLHRRQSLVGREVGVTGIAWATVLCYPVFVLALSTTCVANDCEIRHRITKAKPRICSPSRRLAGEHPSLIAWLAVLCLSSSWPQLSCQCLSAE